MQTLPRYKAAACHASPIYFDVEATVEKACSLIAEAARNGASLIAFPEAFLCAFPVWSGVRAPVENHEFFVQMARSSLRIDGPELLHIRKVAKQLGVTVSMGLNESTSASLGCIYDTNVLIGSNGDILVHHRKLVPTFWEKLTWANGDGRGLVVVDTEVGRLGALICGENTNPLARYSLIAQGEQVHVASYSPRWPTHPVGDRGNYDLAAAIRIRSGAHAFEGKCFNVVASGFFSDDAADLICRGESKARELIESSPRSVSLIIDPNGNVVSEVLQNEEGIVYGEIDINRCVIPKQFHDLSGGYNRFDVFQLSVNRSAHTPAQFSAPLLDGLASLETFEEPAADVTGTAGRGL
jgi:nitrilase